MLYKFTITARGKQLHSPLEYVVKADECLNLRNGGSIRRVVDCEGASVLLASKVVSNKLSPMEQLFSYLRARFCNVVFIIVV